MLEPILMSFHSGGPDDPHRDRMRKLISAHPEVRKLLGNEPRTAFFIVGLVLLQTCIAVQLHNQSWVFALAAAWTVGAVVSLGLWVLIHECVHDLVFRSSRSNFWMLLLANLPLVLPVADGFRKYHLMHHRHFGNPTLDPDVPSPWEARVVGHSGLRKALWMTFYWIPVSLRVTRIKNVSFLDGRFALNAAVQAAFCILAYLLGGSMAVAYLALSSSFAIGLHPLGARSVQEHFSIELGQETTSYYGWANRLVFNAGYHVEHHDLPRVPWNRLPRVKSTAPEYYDGLRAHTSWTALLYQFLFDRRFTLFERIVRRSGHRIIVPADLWENPARAEEQNLASAARD